MTDTFDFIGTSQIAMEKNSSCEVYSFKFTISKTALARYGIHCSCRSSFVLSHNAFLVDALNQISIDGSAMAGATTAVGLLAGFRLNAR